jgi:hypothetical protein
MNPHHEIQVPFDERGNLMHHASPHAPHGTLDAAYEWRAPKSFKAALHLRETRRGRSAAYFLWYDHEGHEFPMFISDTAYLMQQTRIVTGTVVGTFIPIRRGSNYGIRYVGP